MNGSVHHPDNWKGYNVMGDLLTLLRSSLMDDLDYGDEAKAAREQTAARMAKRPRESPGGGRYWRLRNRHSLGQIQFCLSTKFSWML